MKEVTFKFFLNGKEVKQNEIDWDRTSTVRSKDGEVHVKYMSYMLDEWVTNLTGEPITITNVNPIKGHSTRFKSAKEYPGGILGIQEEVGTPATPYTLTPEDFANVRKTVVSPLQDEYKKTIPKVDYDAWNKFFEVPEGVKHNKHKAPLDIVQTRQFPKALQLLALATAYGNKKYEATDKDFLNFKRVAGGSQTYFDAAARHSVDRFGKDKESGLPHIIHAVWDNMAALEMWAEENKLDLEDFSKKYLENLHNSK